LLPINIDYFQLIPITSNYFNYFSVAILAEAILAQAACAGEREGEREEEREGEGKRGTVLRPCWALFPRIWEPQKLQNKYPKTVLFDKTFFACWGLSWAGPELF
jgi:hypothetical protein